ncbi:hypothetical protein SDC9_211110 [bioreactor metagenome]|uniref:Uncharacterized protein n=1 Tax=bioreactor metagenome TaxID=1076179 RepID=A0A645JJE3_9ZZZZ
MIIEKSNVNLSSLMKMRAVAVGPIINAITRIDPTASNDVTVVTETSVINP